MIAWFFRPQLEKRRSSRLHSIVPRKPSRERRRQRYSGARATLTQSPCVVIVGGGFAGIEVAKALQDSPARVTVIDRHNYTLFQPLLYQVATAALSPADVAAPIRGLLHAPNTEVLLDEVVGVDLGRSCVRTIAGREIDFSSARARDRLTIQLLRPR